jgi:N-acetylmuramoyl-L-alanine amidase
MPKICLDPGHGGQEQNYGITGYAEAAGALIVAKQVKELLERHSNFKVLLTRESDIDLSLSQRSQASDAYEADILVSIHSNAGPSSARGIEVFHSINSRQGRGGNKLASHVLNGILKEIALENRGVKTRESITNPGTDFYGMIRQPKASSVIVEQAFHSNCDDEAILKTENSGNKTSRFALGIYNGICAYFNVNPILESTPAVQPQPPVNTNIYRIRKNWADAASQIGAYRNFDSAKALADANPDYIVFDKFGNAVYIPQHSGPASLTETQPFTGTAIMGKSAATLNQCNLYIRSKNPLAIIIADIYFKLEYVYGVRADIAFAQMCWETHNFLFDGRVPATANNPVGMGAVDDTNGYEIYDTIEHGIEAQFQHLLAYATKNQLPLNVILHDTRFKYVQHGAAPWVEWLGIQENPLHTGWASDPGYGAKVLNVLADILKMPDVPVA